jgi:hypothetical protein
MLWFKDVVVKEILTFSDLIYENDSRLGYKDFSATSGRGVH